MTYNLSADGLLLSQNIYPSSYGLLTTVDSDFREIEIVCNNALQPYENAGAYILKRYKYFNMRTLCHYRSG
jgi:hypothetical protein